jgi:hypothetical protein
MPKSLEDPLKRAQFVHFLDANITVGSEFWEYDKEKKQHFLQKMKEESKTYLPDVEDDNARINIALRLWAGCITAAKTLREKYVFVDVDGTKKEDYYTPLMRENSFRDDVDPLSKGDMLYCAGVEVAPILIKNVRDQPLFVEGVPPNSKVKQELCGTIIRICFMYTCNKCVIYFGFCECSADRPSVLLRTPYRL